MSVAPRRFRSAATSASICLRVESCCASVCVPPEGTGGGAGFSWPRNRRLRNFIWTPQSLPNDASAPLLAVYHTALSHSRLVIPRETAPDERRAGSGSFHFRTGFAATTSRSSRNDPLGRAAGGQRHGLVRRGPSCPHRRGLVRQEGWGGPMNDLIAHYRVSGRSSVIRAPFVETG